MQIGRLQIAGRRTTIGDKHGQMAVSHIRCLLHRTIAPWFLESLSGWPQILQSISCAASNDKEVLRASSLELVLD